MNAVFNDFYGGIQVYHLALGYHHKKWETSFCGGLQYFNYGKTDETDASGNNLGQFRPTDWMIQVSASRKYEEKWNYGAGLKFISSNYGQFRSNGIAIDIGILFEDTANLVYVSGLVKNLGVQLKKYTGTLAGDLPFDLQVGVTKRLRGAPLSFSITAQQAHRFDISYNDTAFNNENGFANNAPGKFTFDKLFRHFVISTTVYLGDKVEVYAGYNFLRRKELSIGSSGNGITGFSIGAGAHLGKLSVRFARAYYQSHSAYNQIGLNLKLNEYFGLGRFGEKIGW